MIVCAGALLILHSCRSDEPGPADPSLEIQTESEMTQETQIERLNEITKHFASELPPGAVLLTKEDINMILASWDSKTPKDERDTLAQTLLIGQSSDETDIEQFLLDYLRKGMDADPKFRTFLLQIINERSKIPSK